MAYYWLYNTSNDNIYILILIIVMLGLIIINFKLWTRKTDRFGDVQTGVWREITSGEITDVSSFYQQLIINNNFENNAMEFVEINGVLYKYTSDSIYQKNIIYINDLSKIYVYVLPNSVGTTTTQPPGGTTTTRPGGTTTTQSGTAKWINLATGNQFNVTQAMYNGSLSEEGTYTLNKTGQVAINGITYTYVSPSPFGVNNSIFDTSTFNNTIGATPEELKFFFIYVTPTPTTLSSTQPQTTSNTPTTTKVTGAWINLLGNPVNATQGIYNLSIVQGPNNYYNKINTGSILINGTTYNYLSPSPFNYGNTNYNIIKDIYASNRSQSSNSNDPNYNDPNFIYIYVNSNSIPQSSNPQSSNPQTTMSQSSNPQSSNPQSSNPQSSNPQSSNPQTTMPKTTMPQTTISQSSNPQSSNPQSTMPQSTLPQTTLPQTTMPKTTMPQTITYDNPLNPNFYISKEEEARRNAWLQLDGNEESLPNTNGTNTTYQNDILYNPNNSGLLNNNPLNLALTYSTIGDYATIDSLGAKLTDTIGGINSNLGYTMLDEQLGTFNNYSNTVPNEPNPYTYDNTANYNTGMNPYTVNGRSSGTNSGSGSGTVSSVGSGISGKFTQDNKPIFMQKDFDGVSNIFAPNIFISNPPLTEDGNPDISFKM